MKRQKVDFCCCEEEKRLVFVLAFSSLLTFWSLSKSLQRSWRKNWLWRRLLMRFVGLSLWRVSLVFRLALFQLLLFFVFFLWLFCCKKNFCCFSTGIWIVSGLIKQESPCFNNARFPIRQNHDGETKITVVMQFTRYKIAHTKQCPSVRRVNRFRLQCSLRHPHT